MSQLSTPPPLVMLGMYTSSSLIHAPKITHLNCIESRCIFKCGQFKLGLGALSLLPCPFSSPSPKSLSIRLSKRVATPFVHYGPWHTLAPPALLGEGFQDQVLQWPSSRWSFVLAVIGSSTKRWGRTIQSLLALVAGDTTVRIIDGRDF